MDFDIKNNYIKKHKTQDKISLRGRQNDEN